MRVGESKENKVENEMMNLRLHGNKRGFGGGM